MPRLQSTPAPVTLPPLSTLPSRPAALAPQMPTPSPTLPGDQLQVTTKGQATPVLSLISEPQFIQHKVRRGETLSDIARQYLGNPNRHNEIYQLNRSQLDNPDDLRIGMMLKVPAPAGSQPAPKPVETPTQPTAPVQPAPADVQFTTYTVQRGDNLSSIALDTLGDSERYMEIFKANRDVLKDPDALRKGMVLKIPHKPNETVKPTAPTSPTAPVTGPVDASGLTPGAQELLGAMQRYQQYNLQHGNLGRAKTTPGQMVEIARELDSASKAFKVDPKMMLAVFAHESGGINPGARSHTGAGGLGQLTSIAIRQVHYMAGISKGHRGQAPYTDYKSNFIQSTRSIKSRYDIKANVWTSVAYMSYELNERASLGRGVEKALKRYGDPHVPTYANKVQNEYKTLFGGKLF